MNDSPAGIDANRERDDGSCMLWFRACRHRFAFLSHGSPTA